MIGEALKARFLRRPGGLSVSRREPVARALGRPGPGHELVEARGRPQIDELTRVLAVAKRQHQRADDLQMVQAFWRLSGERHHALKHS